MHILSAAIYNIFVTDRAEARCSHTNFFVHAFHGSHIHTHSNNQQRLIEAKKHPVPQMTTETE
jgi:hypothetical protein